jgi:hypothetical protein
MRSYSTFVNGVGRSGTEKEGGLAHNQASQNYHDAQRGRHTNEGAFVPPRKFKSFKEEGVDDTEEFEEDNDFDGTSPTKMNTVPRPKRALKALLNQK